MSRLKILRPKTKPDQQLLFERIDEVVDLALSAKDVTPEERHQLRHLLRYYSSHKKVFTACVRDNRKRFPPGRVEKVCAVVTDLVKGNTHWRHGGKTMHASEDGYCYPITPEVADLLSNIPPNILKEIRGTDA